MEFSSFSAARAFFGGFYTRPARRRPIPVAHSQTTEIEAARKALRIGNFPAGCFIPSGRTTAIVRDFNKLEHRENEVVIMII